ncbi:hypothetical protein I312_106286 [Cryptococcus bacillisporus CA1280]|uniref:uncharacterized protein n=1 Tax=Cryptococcus bacillisporus CA1280 TaxID=1296109 RepID=UPI00336673B2
MGSSGTTSNNTQNSSDQGKSSKKVAKTWPNSSSTNAKKAAAALSQNVEKAYDSIAESFGGEKQINKFESLPVMIKKTFAEKTVFPNVIVPNKTSKVLFIIIGIAVLQIIVPIFQWPFILLASFLQFTFLYSSGIEELQKGSPAVKVQPRSSLFLQSLW